MRVYIFFINFCVYTFPFFITRTEYMPAGKLEIGIW